MTLIVLSAASTTAITPANNDSVFVLAGVTLIVSGDEAITASATSHIENHGTIFGESGAILAGSQVGSTVSMIYNGTEGIISSGLGADAAIVVHGYHAIENYGQISGNLSVGNGIQVSGSGDIANFGSISGRVGLMNHAGSVSWTVDNAGTIRGSLYGIWVQFDATALITNTGTIFGTVQLGNGAGTVFDSSLGTVVGGIIGGSSSDTISSGRHGNHISGGLGEDTLNGDGGNDTIFGGADNDLVFGGDGNDRVQVESPDGTDTLDGGAGVDYLVLDRSGTTANLTLSIRSASVVQELADGTEIVNFERLSFYGGSGRDNITGGARTDVLNGNAGADTLNGDGGSDQMVGGSGADSYVVDRLTDVVIETVVSTAATEADLVTFTGTSGVYVLGANVENLTLGGSAAISGAGNSGNNRITGNAAANLISGGTGSDTLIGMGGSDTYTVNSSGDQVIETITGASGGNDLVNFSATSGSYTLGSNVERLMLTGSAALNGTGNTEANQITGNTGSNVLAGLGGNDTLAGGLGADRFVFNTVPNSATNVDLITDFNPLEDLIHLENTGIFTALGAATGTLNGALFKDVSLGAVDTTDRILYNDATGTLSYDVDGSGAALAIVFAVLAGSPTVTAADFVVI